MSDPEKTPPTMFDFDASAIFTLAGGTGRLIELLGKYNFPQPDLQTVYAWKTRNRISTRWLPVVIYALLSEGNGIHTMMRVVATPTRPDPIED